MTKQATLDRLNDEIRAAVYAIAEAEMAGLRGAAMIQLHANLRTLKAAHKAAR